MVALKSNFSTFFDDALRTSDSSAICFDFQIRKLCLLEQESCFFILREKMDYAIQTAIDFLINLPCDEVQYWLDYHEGKKEEEKKNEMVFFEIKCFFR